MTKYELNFLGEGFIYEAENEDQATLQYISDVLTGGTYQYKNLKIALTKYRKYMRDVKQDPILLWSKVKS